MARLLFRLRNVPDDEATEVRELLSNHNIAFYETNAGNWGISMPGLWLHNDEDYLRARSLLDDYQQARALRMRDQYETDCANGQADSMIDVLRREPAKVIGYLVLVAAVIFISISIFY